MKGLKVTALSVALSGLLALSGCSSGAWKGLFDPPDSGTVYRKTYDPGHWSQEVTNYCDQYNRDGNCIHSTAVYWQQWHPPTWSLCIEDDKDNDYRGCREVDSGTYSKYTEGGHYPDPR